MNSPNVLEITDANFDEVALASSVPVVLDFGAAWCPPCKAMEPHLDAVAAAYAGRARVGSYDVDKNRHVADRFGVTNLPTFVVLRDGKVVDRAVGAMPRARLEAMLERALR